MVSWGDDDVMVRGSLTLLRRRCGDSGCRCARGELHETPVLSYTQGGKARMLSLRPADVGAVAAALARYREAEAALAAAGEAGREALAAHLKARRARRGRQ